MINEGQALNLLDPTTAHDVDVLLSWFLKAVIGIFVFCGGAELLLYGVKSIIETGVHLFGRPVVVIPIAGAGQGGKPE